MNTTMTHDCKTCPVSTGTHKPAEALHQIDEPLAEALLELAAYRFTVENREARIAELEGQLEAIGAGGVEPLHKQVAPQAVQAAVPDGWKRVPVEPTQAMIDAMLPVEEVGYWAMYEAAIACAPEAPAATQPAAQGMDAQTAYEAECFRWLRDKALDVWKKGPVVFMTDADGCPGSGGELTNNILTGKKLEQAIPVAAQAKQGGAE